MMAVFSKLNYNSLTESLRFLSAYDHDGLRATSKRFHTPLNSIPLHSRPRKTFNLLSSRIEVAVMRQGGRGDVRSVEIEDEMGRPVLSLHRPSPNYPYVERTYDLTAEELMAEFGKALTDSKPTEGFPYGFNMLRPMACENQVVIVNWELSSDLDSNSIVWKVLKWGCAQGHISMRTMSLNMLCKQSPNRALQLFKMYGGSCISFAEPSQSSMLSTIRRGLIGQSHVTITVDQHTNPRHIMKHMKGGGSVMGVRKPNNGFSASWSDDGWRGALLAFSCLFINSNKVEILLVNKDPRYNDCRLPTPRVFHSELAKLVSADDVVEKNIAEKLAKYGQEKLTQEKCATYVKERESLTVCVWHELGCLYMTSSN